MAPKQPSQPRPAGEGIKIITAGLFRMGTKSMATAYQILGFTPHHGLMEDMFDTPWALLEQAAEAKWPNVPGARPRPPFKREDWESIWGNYDAVADLASPFALDLAAAYPEAKVIVVQRDFDSWWPSFRSQVLDGVMIQPFTTIFGFIENHCIGTRSIAAMRKIHFGFYKSQTKEEIYASARERYTEYFNDVRRTIPPERRLEYKLGDGWEPLCTFLGVPVPDVDFPRVNDRSEHAKTTDARVKQFFGAAAKVVVPMFVGFLAMGTAWVYLV
ncbi:hypothetical protein ABW20_dc0104491 [Dactylellina cionopaga]|nr:hypothetical protein ABW20_dc0104491 [Dactylellina cionopaga]